MKKTIITLLVLLFTNYGDCQKINKTQVRLKTLDFVVSVDGIHFMKPLSRIEDKPLNTIKQYYKYFGLKVNDTIYYIENYH